MDSITELIKGEIKNQFGSLAKFSEASGIPYSTLSNALAKGIGGTSYDTVVKICRLLHIRQAYDGDIVLFNQEFHDIYKKMTELDEQGVHTVCAILNAEYDRCHNEQGEPKVKGFNGIGYAVKDEKPFEEARIQELVRRIKKRE